MAHLIHYIVASLFQNTWQNGSQSYFDIFGIHLSINHKHLSAEEILAPISTFYTSSINYQCTYSPANPDRYKTFRL